MKGYYEIEFENVVDLVRLASEVKQRLFTDRSSGVMTKLWFAMFSEQGLCVLNSCMAKQEDIDTVLENIRKAGGTEQVPDPIDAQFAYYER